MVGEEHLKDRIRLHEWYAIQLRSLVVYKLEVQKKE